MPIRYHSTNPFAPTPTDDIPDLTDEWRDEAECYKYIDSIMQDAWVDEESPLKADAMDICLTCPVRELCLRDAAADKEAIGIRGGFEFEDGKVSNRDQQAIKKEFGIFVKARRTVVPKKEPVELRDTL
jgi:hypothetical protein